MLRVVLHGWAGLNVCGVGHRIFSEGEPWVRRGQVVPEGVVYPGTSKNLRERYKDYMVVLLEWWDVSGLHPGAASASPIACPVYFDDKRPTSTRCQSG